MLIHLMEVALKETIFLTQSQALFSKAVAKHITQQNADVTTENIINKDRESRWQPISVFSITWFSLVHKLEFAIFLETEYHRNLKPAKLH